MKNREVNYNNIQYGMLVEVLHDAKEPKGNYHAGMKVHFFNQKGVLVGNIYEFISYDRLRFRLPYKNGRKRNYERTFMNLRFEKIRDWFFIRKCRLTTILIRSTQNKMHRY